MRGSALLRGPRSLFRSSRGLAVVGGGLLAAGGALAAAWAPGWQPPALDVVGLVLNTWTQLEAVPLHERRWALLLAGLLGLVFAGQRGRSRRPPSF